MAFVPLVPGNLTATIRQGLAQQIQSGAIKNAAGTVIDLSAWVSLTAIAIPAASNPTSAPVTFGTVTADAGGIVYVNTSASDFASNGTGTSQYVISGKPTSGDSAQLLVSGTLTVAQG